MKLTPSALTYTLENLMEIAFPELPHTIELGKNDALVTLLGDIQLRFMLMDSEQNENLLSGTLRLSTLHTSWGMLSRYIIFMQVRTSIQLIIEKLHFCVTWLPFHL